MRPYAQRLGWVSEPATAEQEQRLVQVTRAAGDRLKTAGDILDFPEFFTSATQLQWDEKDFEKRIRQAGAGPLLTRLRPQLAVAEPFTAVEVERVVKQFLADEGLKIGDIIHALRVAVTGKSVGLGMFDALELLGRDETLARIDRTLEML